MYAAGTFTFSVMHIDESSKMPEGMYDGFHRAQDPREYLDAPAMLIPGYFPNESGGYGDGGAALVAESIKACDAFQILAPEDLHGFEVELTVLRTRIADIVNRIDVETKMREAASSLSKLHTGGPTSPKSPRRLSRIFHSGESNTNDKKRLSRQAEDEVTLSKDRIRHLEDLRQELVDRQREIERRILEHHSAVLSRAVQGKPAGPTHRRGFSGSTVASSHQNPYASPKNAGASDSHSMINAELNSLVQRLQGAFPQFSPASSPTAYIQNVLRHLLQTCDERADEVDAYRTQANSAEERIQFLTHQLNTREPTSTENAERSAELQKLRNDLNSERSRSLELKQRFASQRKELENVVLTLENVTKSAIRYETERRQYESIVEQLESKIAQLDDKVYDMESAKLRTSRNTSNLCDEFRRIVKELHESHHAEVRDIRKRSLQSLGTQFFAIDEPGSEEGAVLSPIVSPTTKPNDAIKAETMDDRPTEPLSSSRKSRSSGSVSDEQEMSERPSDRQQTLNDSFEGSSLLNVPSQDAGSSLYASENGTSSSAIDIREKSTLSNASDPITSPQKNITAEDNTYDDSGSVMTTPQLNSRPVAAVDEDDFL